MFDDQKIIIVDDEVNVLSAFKRQLKNKFLVDVAQSGSNALEMFENNGPYALVVSDMRMPGMDGISFLKKVKLLYPDTIRIMLTGNADLNTAIKAVNDGNVFRFLQKPCDRESLTMTINEGLRIFRLSQIEKELLEKTLNGSIKVLVDVISLTNPEAFSRSNRIVRYVNHITKFMSFSDKWQFEIAALLSQIGCITLPQDLLNRVYANETLTPNEREMFDKHPQVAKRLLVNIPRFYLIANMIANQNKHYHELQVDNLISKGAQLLSVAINFDRLILSGFSPRAAIDNLRERAGLYNPDFIEALSSYNDFPDKISVKQLALEELKVGMEIDENIYLSNGVLLVRKGQEITYPLLVKLKNFSGRSKILDKIRVIVTEFEYSIPTLTVKKAT